MPQPHLGAELQQPCLSRGRRRLDTDPEALRGPPHQHRVPDRIGCGELYQAPGLGRKSVELPLKAFLDPSRQRNRARQPESAGQLTRRQPARQFQQRQRIPPRLGDNQVSHPRVQRRSENRVQQDPRIIVPQGLHRQFRQTGQLLASRAGREDQADRFGLQPPGHERENLGRGPVEPLLVIHQAQQRPRPGRIRQQAQHGQANQEPIRRRPGIEAERGSQRRALRVRQALRVI